MFSFFSNTRPLPFISLHTRAPSFFSISLSRFFFNGVTVPLPLLFSPEAGHFRATLRHPSLDHFNPYQIDSAREPSGHRSFFFLPVTPFPQPQRRQPSLQSPTIWANQRCLYISVAWRNSSTVALTDPATSRTETIVVPLRSLPQQPVGNRSSSSPPAAAQTSTGEGGRSNGQKKK